MDKIRNIYNDLRATRRIAALFPASLAILALTAVQGFIVSPFTDHKSTVIPNLIYKIARRLLGIKVVFNQASEAPIVRDRPVWFVSNHTYGNDYIPLAGKINGAFVGKTGMLKVPVLGQVARAMSFIAINRSHEFVEQARGKIIENFNAGHSAIMFPEGTVGDGIKINLFRAGLITLLFGEKGVDEQGLQVTLKNPVDVQPVAMRLAKLDGKDVTHDAAARSAYRMKGEKPLKVIWNKLKYRQVIFEMTAFEPLKPADFKGEDAAKDMINQAAEKIAHAVNPGQNTFEKAAIPAGKKAAAPASAL